MWERDEQGVRHVVPFKAPYYFYVPDENGEYTSLFGDKLKRIDFDSKQDYENGLKQHRVRFESDFTPLQRVLMDEYYGVEKPTVNFAFFDLEADYSADADFPDPMNNPYAPINAMTVYQSWTKKFVTTAVLPKGLRKSFNRKKFKDYCDIISKKHKLFVTPDVEIMVDEAELLERFIKDIDNSDILSGWNSEYFDIPYIIKRLEKVRPSLVKGMCFTGCKPPKERIIEQYGSPVLTYQLSGRSHLDYLDMFKKFTFEGRTSYSLGSITNAELSAPKLEHEGTLEELYKGTFYPAVSSECNWGNVDDVRDDVLENLTMRRSIITQELRRRESSGVLDPNLSDYTNDDLQGMLTALDDDVKHCSFAMFCCYNAHDVGCLLGLDKKFNFVNLVNQMTHENTCEFKDLLGTVRYVETGITNRAHYHHQKVVMDKRVMTDGENVEGALVLSPFAGLHKWLGSVDIESLYPSVIRSLCISPERYVGQFVEGEQAWRGIREQSDDIYTLRDDTGEAVSLTGADWKRCLIEQGWVVSGFGTIFDQSSGPGIVDETLSYWFAERKRLKRLKDDAIEKVIHLKKTLGEPIPV